MQTAWDTSQPRWGFILKMDVRNSSVVFLHQLNDLGPQITQQHTTLSMSSSTSSSYYYYCLNQDKWPICTCNLSSKAFFSLSVPFLFTLCSSRDVSLFFHFSTLYLYVMCALIYASHTPIHSLSLSVWLCFSFTALYLPPSLITACCPPCVPADDRAETDAECLLMVWQTYTHLVFYLSVPLHPPTSTHIWAPLSAYRQALDRQKLLRY